MGCKSSTRELREKEQEDQVELEAEDQVELEAEDQVELEAEDQVEVEEDIQVEEEDLERISCWLQPWSWGDRFMAHRAINYG